MKQLVSILLIASIVNSSVGGGLGAANSYSNNKKNFQKDEIVQEENQKGETTCEQAGVIAETSKNQDGAEDDLSESNDKANEDQ